MYSIKKIKVLQTAYTIGLVYLVFGLLLGLLLIIIRSVPALSNFNNPNLAALTIQQIILLYPVAYAAGGFIMSIVIGYTYNKIAKITGGIAIQLKKDK